MKITMLTIFLMGAIFTPAASAGAKELMTVTDMENRRVEVPKSPSQIVCLGPGSLRLICYLGAIEKVVGVEAFEKTKPVGRTYLHAYPSLAERPAIGPGGPAGINKEPDLEAVLKVNPELIFAANMEPQRADGLQKKLGIPVILLSYGGFATFDEVVFDSLRLAGRILQLDRRAEEVIAFIERSRKDLLERTAKYNETAKPRVYIGGIGFRGTQGIESTDASYFPLDWVRARNLAKEITLKGHLFANKEKILSWNPDLIFIDGGGWKTIQQDFQRKPEYYTSLKAFPDRKAYLLFPFNWYVTNIDTALIDAYVAGKILYPDIFPHVHPPQKADEIYSFFLMKPIYEAMKKEFGEIGQSVSFGL
jgi:iron complex transport system substrate-binding protein